MPRLPHDAVGAGRVDRPQNRADVVRILDAVEHDDERRARRAGDQILDARRARALRDVGDDALMRRRRRAARSSSAGATRRTGTPCALGGRTTSARRPPARSATRAASSRVRRAAPRAPG